jgi:hypothetical protein
MERSEIRTIEDAMAFEREHEESIKTFDDAKEFLEQNGMHIIKTNYNPVRYKVVYDNDGMPGADIIIGMDLMTSRPVMGDEHDIIGFARHYYSL